MPISKPRSIVNTFDKLDFISKYHTITSINKDINGNITNISYDSGISATFTYTNNLLTKSEYFDNNSTLRNTIDFIYDSNNNLVSTSRTDI